MESGSVVGFGGVGSAEDDYMIRRAVGAATSEGCVGGGEREARGASSVDVFEETSAAVGAGDGGGDPDEAVAAVAPVRSRSHGDREDENVESNREGEDEGNGGGLSFNNKET